MSLYAPVHHNITRFCSKCGSKTILCYSCTYFNANGLISVIYLVKSCHPPYFQIIGRSYISYHNNNNLVKFGVVLSHYYYFHTLLPHRSTTLPPVTMSSEDWEALPKRNRNKRSCTATSTSCEIRKQPSMAKAKVGYEDRLAMITNAVSERSEANKATSLASLTSLDGCAGENYEYLDHTADVQCHTWGGTLIAAFETMVSVVIAYCVAQSKVGGFIFHAMDMTGFIMSLFILYTTSRVCSICFLFIQGPCMFNYMTDLSTVDINLEETRTISVTGLEIITY
jgi:hypothetical protein